MGGALLPGGNDLTTAQVAQGTVISAMIGGTASVISGGKFSNGAKTAAMQYMFNQAGDSIERTLRTLVSYGRVAAGGLQITAGKGMCLTVVFCGVGAPLIAQGVGNVGGGVSDYLDILGYKTDFNLTEQLYEKLSPGNGKKLFLSVDVATGVAGLAAGLRQVPVIMDKGSTIQHYTTMSAFRIQGTTAPAIINDVLQTGSATKGLNDL